MEMFEVELLEVEVFEVQDVEVEVAVVFVVIVDELWMNSCLQIIHQHPMIKLSW